MNSNGPPTGGNLTEVYKFWRWKFAGQIMSGFARGDEAVTDLPQVAEEAVLWADALIEELEKE